MSEFIYILENPSFPNVVKIGKTARDVADRVRELSSHTGVPTEFSVVRQYAVENATIAERRVHQRLSEYRVSENREFFKLSPDEAALILEEMLAQNKKPLANTDREDELLFSATQIAITMGKLWPSALAGPLEISHEHAEELIHVLQGRGIINSEHELCSDLMVEHKKRLREQSKKQKMAESAALALAETHYQMIQRVKELLAGLVDPETGEEVEVSFNNNNGNLAVDIRGSEWIKSEAQKRLSVML